MDQKWTNNEPYERSKRKIVNSQNETPFMKINKEQEISAYTSSLHYDENTWDILNQSAAKNGFQISNKREEIGSKMSDRSLIQQTNVNPFLEQNYVEDVFIRDKFLKPINTTHEMNEPNK